VWRPADRIHRVAIATEVDVEQGDVRPQLGGLLKGLGTGRRDADDRGPLAFQQAAGGVQEARAVINDETAS